MCFRVLQFFFVRYRRTYVFNKPLNFRCLGAKYKTSHKKEGPYFFLNFLISATSKALIVCRINLAAIRIMPQQISEQIRASWFIRCLYFEFKLDMFIMLY